MTWLIIGCTQKPKYTIGVSQCSEDIWREKQNAELCTAAYFHEGVELKFAAAYDSDERQVQQIDSLVDSGIDLLIVAPNQVQTISPAIDRAYDKGIPVIVFERKTNSQKYTSFISADNYEMGRHSSVPTTTRWGASWVNTSPVDCMAKDVSWKSWDSRARHRPSSATTVSLMP